MLAATGVTGEPGRAGSGRASRPVFLGVSALLFAASAAATTAWCDSMPGMDGMPMPGGWTMSKAWMRMPGQSWPGAAISFVRTWVAMMVAMMLPSLVPALGRYRDGVGPAAGSRLARLTAIVGTAYFVVWTALGLVVFSLGAGLAAIAMREPALARLVPLATGVGVLLAGVFQWSAWKARRLAACRAAPSCAGRPPADAASAWRHGLALGLRCSGCCAGLTAVLLVGGVMDLCTMAGVAAAVTAERLAPGGTAVARATGAVLLGAGALLIARALGLG
jgi:predicted metal-binding membrane protein